jgi:plastocyanin
VVNGNQGVRWAVVQIASAGGAKSSAEQPKLDQKGCDFSPRVVIARPGEEMAVLNNDGILHNVHTYSEANPAMNMAQPGFVQTLPVTFGEAEVIKVKCDVHGWMTAWIMVTDSPYAAVTDDAGSFSLADVPAGKHRLTVWHEKLGEQQQEITVADSGQTEVTFEFSAR